MGNQAMLGVDEETRNRLYNLKGDRTYDEIINQWMDKHEANE